MIVDGKLITGLAEIEIRPVQSDAKKDFDFQLPVMTFLPLKL